MDIAIGLIVCALIGYGVYRFVWLKHMPKITPPPTAKGELTRLCRGDAAQAERLIEAELKRSPGITEHEAARRATDSLRRDQR